MSLYRSVVKRLVAGGALDPALPTLVVAGGATDREVLLEAGFTNVTISNLDVRMSGDEFAPCKWRFLDGEELAVEPGEYAQIIEHMGLHHCGSPHRGLLEMYRCAGQSLLVFENRDSLSMRLALGLGLVRRFEFEAVADHGYVHGGYRNTGVPNAVYRWTEREVEQVLASYDPAHEVPVRFFHGLRLPHERVALMRNPLARLLARASFVPFALLAQLFPSQMNEFGWFIDKRASKPRPWIDPATGALSQTFAGKG
jgi:hypothetical protein